MIVLAFALTSLIWGASFLLIKLALEGFTPLGLVTVRLTLALLFLAVYIAVRRRPLSRDVRFWAGGAALGLVDIALPFFAISWGEQYVESGIASILNSTTPLFTLLLVPFLYRADRLPPTQTLGVLGGFAGVLVVVSGGGVSGTLAGKLAVMVGALGYAVGGLIISRYMRAYDFVSVIGVAVAASLLLVAPITLAAGELELARPGPVPWACVSALGVLGTGVAYAMFMEVIRAWGPTRASMITYAIPPIGVLLGVIVRSEPVTWRLLAGGALIGLGVVAANRPRPVGHEAGRRPEP